MFACVQFFCTFAAPLFSCVYSLQERFFLYFESLRNFQMTKQSYKKKVLLPNFDQKIFLTDFMKLTVFEKQHIKPRKNIFWFGLAIFYFYFRVFMYFYSGKIEHCKLN
jgi:hypothetical protein